MATVVTDWKIARLPADTRIPDHTLFQHLDVTVLPAEVDARPDSHGKIKLGLWAAWQVVRGHFQAPARDLIDNHGQELRDLLSIRNNSILAHGFDPVPRSSWNRSQQWTQDRLLPVLDHYAKKAGVRKPVEQLPTDPPEPTTT